MLSFRGEHGSFFAKNLGTPFVISFMVLLGFNSALVTAGQTTLSNIITMSAYILLAIGIVLQIVSGILSDRHLETREKESIRDD